MSRNCPHAGKLGTNQEQLDEIDEKIQKRAAKNQDTYYGSCYTRRDTKKAIRKEGFRKAKERNL